MKSFRQESHLLVILLVFCLFRLVIAEDAGISVKEIVDNNISASGGKDNVANVMNYSFRSDQSVYYLNSEGQMKITSGRAPIITEVILVDKAKARRNCYNKETEFEGFMKWTYQALATLRSGLFTLKNFESQLKLEGMRRFGPQEYYLLSTQVGELSVEFFIDSTDFGLKRMVLKGFSPETGRYEVNHDFGPLKEIGDIKIPSSWFQSEVGTRGRQHKVEDVMLDRTFDEGFFEDFKVNVGEVKTTQDELNGNITEFRLARGSLMIGTNWTSDCIQKAGFKENDKLTLHIAEKQFEIEFYDSMPPRSAFEAGVKLMMPNRADENYVIYLISPENEQLAEELNLLMPIKVKKKS